MQSAIGTQQIPSTIAIASPGKLWTGRTVTGLIAAFLVFDGVMKLIHPKPVLDGFARSGWPIDLSVTLGIILLTSTALYLIPRTAILGAILLTGYLGGAVATNLRLHNPLFGYTLFPVYFGVLVWGALWLRDPCIAELIPLRRRT